MASRGQKVIESQPFALGDQRLWIRLVHVHAARRKPWRVQSVQKNAAGEWVAEGSGWLAADDNEADAREQYEWALAEVPKRGWEVAPKRGGGNRPLKMLKAIPAPLARPQAVPPPTSKLLQRRDERLAKRA